MNVNSLARTIKLLDLDYFIKKPDTLVVDNLNVNAKLLAISPKSVTIEAEEQMLHGMLNVLELEDTELSIAINKQHDISTDFLQEIEKITKIISPKKILYFYDTEQRPLNYENIVYVPHPKLIKEIPNLKRQAYSILLDLAKEL